MGKKIYFNAGYVNTDIDKNDEDDRYIEMRLQIKQMETNKCYGKDLIKISFEKSTVHVPFNVWARKSSVVLGANFTGELDQVFSNNLVGQSTNAVGDKRTLRKVSTIFTKNSRFGIHMRLEKLSLI